MTDYELKYVYDDAGRDSIRQWMKDYSREMPLQVLYVERGTILPRRKPNKNAPYSWMGLGGVVNADNEYIPLSGIKHILKEAYVFGGSYEYDIRDVEYVDEDVVYIGPMFNHWGHFIYEFVTRLWYCCKTETGRIAYCGWGFDAGELYGSYKRFFELVGLDTDRLIDIRKPTKFRKIIIPEQCYLRNHYVTPQYKEMMGLAYKNIMSEGLTPFDKIYFTRASFIAQNAWYREYGELAIQKTFEKNGYKIFDPAKLSLDEQIFYMHHCKVAAMVSSSTGADTVFMQEGTERIYIKKGFYMDPDLSQVDYMTAAKRVTVVDCWLRPYKSFRASHSAGPSLIGATDMFLNYLKDNEMQALSHKEYVYHNVCTYLWFLAASIHNKVLGILYPVYCRTLRKLIKKDEE